MVGMVLVMRSASRSRYAAPGFRRISARARLSNGPGGRAPSRVRRKKMTLPIAEAWFVRRSFADGVTLLSERYVDPFARCNVWHVRGRGRDLLVDTGLGVRSLREA